jgi:uncharacterized membrane protein YheB (UPF0754 family)
MSEELIVFLNFDFNLKMVSIKSVNGETLSEVPRHLINWRDYLTALTDSGQTADSLLEPLSEIYLKHLPDEVLFQDLLAFQAELRENLGRLVSERVWPEETWRHLLRETEGIPVTLEVEGNGDFSPEGRESLNFKLVYLPETYRLRLLLLLRELMVDGRLFNLGREDDGRFFFKSSEPVQPNLVTEDIPALSLSEAAAVRLPAVLAAEAAEKLPMLLQNMVKEKLPEVMEQKLAEEFPLAMKRELETRLPEALAEAVEARLPEQLASKIEAKLPIALAVKVETRLPYALAAMVDKKLPEALAAEVAGQLPAALAREVKARYPEALAKAVAAQLPETLAAEVAHRLPMALEPAVESAFPEALAAKVAAAYPEVLAEKLAEDLPTLLERRVAEELPALLRERVAEKYPETLATAVADCLPEALSREVALKLPEVLAPQVETRLPEALAQAVSERLPEALAEEVAERLPERLASDVAARLPEALQAALAEEKPEAMAALEKDRNLALIRAVTAALPEALERAVLHHLPERLEEEVDRRWPEALERAVAGRLPEALARAVEEKLPETLALAIEAKLPEVLESARETVAAAGLSEPWSAHAPKSPRIDETEIEAAGAEKAASKTRDDKAEEMVDTAASEGADYDRSLREERLGGNDEESVENFGEEGRAIEANAGLEEDGAVDLMAPEGNGGYGEGGDDDEEPILLTEVVNDNSDFDPAALEKDSTQTRGEDNGEAKTTEDLAEDEEEVIDEEDEAPILDLENLEEAPEETNKPDDALGLRRPGSGKKNLEHRLATLDHWFRREPGSERSKKGKH